MPAGMLLSAGRWKQFIGKGGVSSFQHRRFCCLCVISQSVIKTAEICRVRIEAAGLFLVRAV